jgi:hypothetical protein
MHSIPVPTHPVSLPVHAVLSPSPPVFPPATRGSSDDSVRTVSRCNTRRLRWTLADVILDFFIVCPSVECVAPGLVAGARGVVAIATGEDPTGDARQLGRERAERIEPLVLARGRRGPGLLHGMLLRVRESFRAASSWSPPRSGLADRVASQRAPAMPREIVLVRRRSSSHRTELVGHQAPGVVAGARGIVAVAAGLPTCHPRQVGR